MKTITYEEFLDFDPCYLDDPKEKALMDSIAKRQERWTALDILELKEIPDEDKLWAVLREELIDSKMLHKFACACAERALSRVENPDPRSIAAIAAKRAWLRGEITDAELKLAEGAAMDATSAAAWDTAWDAACEAAWDAARDTADTADAASAAASAAAWAAAMDAASAAERAWQVEELKKMLREEEV